MTVKDRRNPDKSKKKDRPKQAIYPCSTSTRKSVKTYEPHSTERYATWCGRGGYLSSPIRCEKFFLSNSQKFLTRFVKYANIYNCVGEDKKRANGLQKSANSGNLSAFGAHVPPTTKERRKQCLLLTSW